MEKEVCVKFVDGLCTLRQLVEVGFAGHEVKWQAVNEKKDGPWPEPDWAMTVSGNVGRWPNRIRWGWNCVERRIGNEVRNYAVVDIKEPDTFDIHAVTAMMRRVVRRVKAKSPAPAAEDATRPPAAFLALELCGWGMESAGSCTLEEWVRIGVGDGVRGWRRLGPGRWQLDAMLARAEGLVPHTLTFEVGCAWGATVVMLAGLAREGRTIDMGSAGIELGPLFSRVVKATDRKWRP
jgi:hypothetical protein